MPAPIHIRYVRSGGFGGLRAVAEVDTPELAKTDPAKAQQIAQLAQAVLGEQPPARPKSPRNDGYQYQLTLQHSGHSQSLTAWEPISSPALRQLVSILDELASLGRSP